MFGFGGCDLSQSSLLKSALELKQDFLFCCPPPVLLPLGLEF